MPKNSVITVENPPIVVLGTLLATKLPTKVNANTETTYVLSKINGKPIREVLLTLSYYGFDIYTKAGEEV